MSDGSGRRDVSEERVGELEERIEELSEELRAPPEGPSGLSRPPTPGEVLAFVDDHAIPTTIAVMTANVRALKALRAAIRLLRRTEERDLPETGRLRDRTDAVAREAVTELDRAVSDLATAIEGEGLPDNDQARSVLQEIRAVRDEVADALTSGNAMDDPAGAEGSSTGGDGDEATADGGGDDRKGVEIDVENELESIKKEMRGDGTDGDGPPEEGDGVSNDGNGSSGTP